MESISSILRKKIIVVLSDGIARDVSDIKQGLEAEGFKYGEDYREGHLSGALRVLRMSGQLQRLERGMYKLPQEIEEGPDTEEPENLSTGLSSTQVKKEMISVLLQQYQYLEKYIAEATLSSLSSEEKLKDAKFLLKLKNNMKEFLIKSDIIRQ